MDLKQMRQFLALAEELNFGRAAERLHMAQPPLTRNIRALEEELGAPLFVRTPKGAELTQAGQALLDEVPNVLALARRAEEQAQLAGQGYVGRLDVGIFSSGILNVIPRLLAQFHTDRPDVKIGLHNMSKADQIAALRERRITIGFNRLDNERMILYPNAPVHGLAQEVTAAFRAEGVRLRVEQEVEDVVTCIALVASRFGVCVTTESAANLRLPGVVYRPLRSKQLRNIELSCLYRRGDTSPILHAMLELIRASRGKYRSQ